MTRQTVVMLAFMLSMPGFAQERKYSWFVTGPSPGIGVERQIKIKSHTFLFSIYGDMGYFINSKYDPSKFVWFQPAFRIRDFNQYFSAGVSYFLPEDKHLFKNSKAFFSLSVKHQYFNDPYDFYLGYGHFVDLNTKLKVFIAGYCNVLLIRKNRIVNYRTSGILTSSSTKVGIRYYFYNPWF